MKIAYAFHQDASNPSLQSGRPASILQEFERLGLDVVRAFPLVVPASGVTFAKQAGYRLVGKLYRGDRNDRYLEQLAARFSARIADEPHDLVFGVGSEEIAHLPMTAPATFCADATFANLVDYYWDFTGLSAEYLRQGHALEAAALRRSALTVYSSEWAARSAIQDYGADPARVAVIPFGANLGSDNRREDVAPWLAARSRSPLRLLFVGRHWERKGGELVVATALCLIAHGHPVVVDIVGCDVPAQHRGVPWIHAHGLLHQNHPEEMLRLRGLFAQAHFVFVPSRAEAYGMTFAEANAFALPAIATRTGGIPSAVRHGCNGLLLAPGASPSDYADAIVSVFEHPAKYDAFCLQSFREFEDRLNWRVFCQRYLELIRERLDLDFLADARNRRFAAIA